MRVVDPEHGSVRADVETGQRALVGVLAHQLVDRDLPRIEG